MLSGHTYQYVDRVIAGVRHVWLPSTAYVFPDTTQERIGDKVTGIAVLELSADGYQPDIVRPDGVLQHNLVEQPFYAATKNH